MFVAYKEKLRRAVTGRGVSPIKHKIGLVAVVAVVVLVGLKLAWPAFATIENGKAATDVLGQTTGGLLPTDALPSFTSSGIGNVPNAANTSAIGVAVDSTNRHLLFVTDGNNHRVLAYPIDAEGHATSLTASYVLGQPDFKSASYGTTDTKMQYPGPLTYDAVNDRLFVSDSGNNRVLVFDFLNDGLHNGMAARFVLGQDSMTCGLLNHSGDCTSSLSNPTAATMSNPSGLAYDATSGHERLFVADSYNNRVLAFEAGPATLADGLGATWEVGQPAETAFTSGGSNTTIDGLTFPNGVAYDATLGNQRLFVADTGSQSVRVFNLPNGVITNGMEASNELGYDAGDLWKFNSNFNYCDDTEISCGSRFMYHPGDLTYDPVAQRLFVSDVSHNRVLVFSAANVTDGEAATSVLGQADFTHYNNNRDGSANVTAGGLSHPWYITWDAQTSRLFVADTYNSRLLGFDSTSISIGHDADDEVGQVDNDVPDALTSILTKGSDDLPNRVGMSTPSNAVFDTKNHRLFVSETGNNRVLEYDLNSSNELIDRVPDHVLGTASFNYMAPATTAATGFSNPTGLAYDVDADRLFVTDTDNSRVLVFDAGPVTLADGMAAAYELGQSYVDGSTEFTTGVSSVSRTGMSYPVGLAYDNAHNRLFVADDGNYRVLVFDVATVAMENGKAASYELGQPYVDGDAEFETQEWATSRTGMYHPRGVAYDATPGNERLFVADTYNNRVLEFGIPDGDITNGMAASHVLGQSDFDSGSNDHGSSVGGTGMSYPWALAFDAGHGRLFVADYYNSRVLAFSTTSIIDGQAAVNVIGQPDMSSNVSELNDNGVVSAVGLNNPQGVAFDSATGQLAVADRFGNRVMLYGSLAPDPALNHAPTAVADSYETYYDNTLTVADVGLGVLANDTDQDGRTMSVRVEPGLGHDVQHGTLNLNWDGTFDYTPNPGYYGQDSFDYEVNDGLLTATATATINVPQAHAPTAVNDSYSAVAGETLTVAAPGVLGNDSDQDGRDMTVTLQTDVRHGTLNLSWDGSFDYTPNVGSGGADSFTYQVDDGMMTATATVDISVSDGGVSGTHYLWRTDNGDEVGASTIGSQDTPLADVAKGTVQRLRFGVKSDDASATFSQRNMWPTAGQLNYLNLNPVGAYPAGTYVYYMSYWPDGSGHFTKAAAKAVTDGDGAHQAGDEISSFPIVSGEQVDAVTIDGTGAYAYLAIENWNDNTKYVSRVDLAAMTRSNYNVAEFSSDEGPPADMKIVGVDLYVGTRLDSVSRVELLKVAGLSGFNDSAPLPYVKTHVGTAENQSGLVPLATDGTRLFAGGNGLGSAKLYQIDLTGTTFSVASTPQGDVSDAVVTEATDNPCPSVGNNGGSVLTMTLGENHKLYVGCLADSLISYENDQVFIYDATDITAAPVSTATPNYYWSIQGMISASGDPVFAATDASDWSYKLVRLDKATGEIKNAMTLSSQAFPVLAGGTTGNFAYMPINKSDGTGDIQQIDVSRNYNYALQSAPNPGSDCAAATGWTTVPANSGSPSAAWQMSASAHESSDVSTTHDLDLTPESGFAFVSGYWLNVATSTSTVTLDPEQYTEVEFSLAATANATDSGAYCFRLTDNGAPFEGNTVFAEATLGTGTPVTPTISPADIHITPPSPTTGDSVTMSVTAGGTVASITLYPEGDGVGNPEYTCTVLLGWTGPTCTHDFGLLDAGSYTPKAIAYADGGDNSGLVSGAAYAVSVPGAGPASVSVEHTGNDVINGMTTLTHTASDPGGVTMIEAYADGTDPADLVGACSYDPAVVSPDTATCVLHVQLAGGDHVVTWKDYGASGTSMTEDPLHVMQSTVNNVVTLSSYKVNATDVDFSLYFDLVSSEAGDHPLNVDIPDDFTVTAAPSTLAGSSACLGGFGFEHVPADHVYRLTAVKHDCSGVVVLRGAKVSNPAAVGTYIINWNNDSGSAAVSIVADEDIDVAATVDPFIAFEVGADTSCAGDYIADDWTVDLGRLSTGRTVASSGDDGVKLICTRLSTNATSGAVVTVRNANGAGGLVSASVPADLIPSSAAGISSGSPNYGLCYSTVGADAGYDPGVTPAAAPPDATHGAYGVAACTASVTSGAESVAALSGSPVEVWRVGDVTSNAFAALRVKAAISATQPAHNDYQDSLTFIATATY
jgi:hypothetical protein